MSIRSDRVRGNGRRRAAALSGVLGLLLISAGVSLVVQSGAQGAKVNPHNPKNGNIPVLVCHATDSVPNSYVVEYPDADSTGLIGRNGHQAHRDHPNKVWKQSGWWNGTFYTAGSPKRDYIHSYTDAENVFHAEDGNITPSFCLASMTKFLSVVPAVNFVEPTCTVTTGSWNGQSGTGIAGYAVTSGTTNPGDTIVITATAAANYTFSSDPNTADPTQTFTHTFGAVPTDCPTVTPTPTPTTLPSSETPTPTPTVTPPPVLPGTTIGTVAPTFRAPACPSTQAAVNLGGQGFLNAAQLAATNNKFGVNGVIYQVTGTVAPGGTVTVTATAADSTVPITAGQQTSWTHTFGTVRCTLPPPTQPKTVVPSVVHVPTVVHSGLTAAGSGPNIRLRDLGLGMALTGALFLMGSIGLLRRRN